MKSNKNNILLKKINDMYQNPQLINEELLIQILEQFDLSNADEKTIEAIRKLFNLISMIKDEKMRKKLLAIWMDYMTKMNQDKQKEIFVAISNMTRDSEKALKMSLIQAMFDMMGTNLTRYHENDPVTNYKKMTPEVQNTFKGLAGEFFGQKENVLGVKEQEKDIKVSRMPSGTSLKYAIDQMKSSTEKLNLSSKLLVINAAESLCKNLFGKELTGIGFGLEPIIHKKK